MFQNKEILKEVLYIEERPSAREVINLFKAAELNGPLDDEERIEHMIKEAQYILTARVDNQLVGLIRVLTDFSYNAFIADLAVLPEFQNKRIGSQLLNKATQPFEKVKFIIQPGHDSGEFYKKNGFESSPICMVLPRKY